MANIRDIALRAGVSIATVSHVFNDTRPVLEGTRKRVLKAALDLDYKPNMIARSLRRRHTQTIGLVVADIDTPYFSELAHAVEAETSARGYNVILCNSGESMEREQRQIDVLLSRQVDGLILIPAAGDHRYLAEHIRRGARIVLANRCLDGVECPSVVADDEQAAASLAVRLLEQGHRRIGAASWIAGVSSYQARWRGVVSAIEAAGEHASLTWRYTGSGDTDDGKRAAEALVQVAEPPTAVICFNSLIRDGLLLELFAIAPLLLKQVEITGFGYSALAHFSGSSRYFVAQPSREIGRMAAGHLLDALEGTRDWTPGERIVVESRVSRFEASTSSTRQVSTLTVAPQIV